MYESAREGKSGRFRELLTLFAGEPQTFEVLMAILEAKAAPENKQAQALAISVCIAEIMDNPLTPANLYNAIGDATMEIQTSIKPNLLIRSGALVPGLIANSLKQKGATNEHRN